MEYFLLFDIRFNSNVEKVEWECESCEEFFDEGEGIVFEFDIVGIYEIIMKVIDIYGCISIYWKNVWVINECEVRFDWIYENVCLEICSNFDIGCGIIVVVDFVNFLNLGICFSIYKWDFGDGILEMRFSKENIIYKYFIFCRELCIGSGVKIYNVKLIVMDLEGCIDIK